MPGLVECCWSCLAGLLLQGATWLPAPDSARLLVAAWLLFVLVTVASYTGNLVAFLTYPQLEAPAPDLHTLLARRHQYTWGWLDNSSTEAALQQLPGVAVFREILAQGRRHSADQLGGGEVAAMVREQDPACQRCFMMFGSLYSNTSFIC